MRKSACEAILAEGHDRRRHADLQGAEAEIEALRADNERKDAENKALRADNERKDAEIDGLSAENKALRADNERKDAEIVALKRANAHDGGPHTPPSHNTLSGKAEKARKKRSARAKKATDKPARRPGGQKGHKGTTRKPVPTEFKEHTAKNCRRCKSEEIVETGKRTRNITETPPPPKEVTTQHTIHEYDCKGCGLKGFTPETGLPDEGAYGKNVVVETTENFVDRLTNRRIAEKMTRRGAPMGAATAHNVVKRTGKALAGPANAILAAMLLACNVLNVDETSFSLNGKLVWVWIITDPITGMAVYVIRDSRGRKVLEEVLGKWAGTIVCDGWQAYWAYHIQRCWAHILREMHDIQAKNRDDWNAAHVTRMIERIFNDAVAASKTCKTIGARKAARRRLIRRTRYIARQYIDDPVLGKFMGKLDRAAGDLFEFVVDPTIPPTNNIAERGLREIVVHRKIRGAIRAVETMEWMGNLFTCVMTWKSQGKDYREELVKYV